MEKRLPTKSPQLPEEYPSGCRWGLMSFFSLFNGHFSQKLISNARRFDRHKKGNGSANGRPKLLPGSDNKYQDENKIRGADPRSASICNSRRGKREEHFSNSLGYSEKNGKTVQVHERSANHANHERRAKVKKISQLQKLSSLREGHQKLYQTDSTNRASHSSLTKVFCGYGCRDIGCVNNGVSGSKAKSARVSDTTASLVNRKLIRANHKSKELLELLEILNFNEELFLRLLEDPNPPLVRHVKGFRGSQGRRTRSDLFTRQHEGNDCSYGTQKGNTHKVSLRRIKPQENPAPKRNHYTRPVNRIVILKPESDFGIRNKVPVVGRSYSPSRRLRRKFRWTQQKKCMPSSVAFGAASSCKVSTSSTNLSLNKDCEKRREQLLELSNWRDVIDKLSRKKSQGSLRRSLSLPGNEFSPFFSPERSSDYGFVGPQMRFCPYGSYQVKDDSKPRHLRETKSSLTSFLDVDTLTSEYNKLKGGSNCLNASAVTQETPTTLAHMSSEGSNEIEISEEEHSSSPGNVQEHEKSVICNTVEDQVEQLEYDETDWVRCRSGSGTVAGELNNDLRSAIDYVRAVLVSADLDRDRSLVNSHVPQQILRPSLFDEVKIHRDGSDINQRLLFDYVNEILEEVHRCHQINVRTFTVEKNVTRAVMKRVHRDQDQLLQKGSPTLEQLVCKDLAYFIKWVDISSNTEEIVTELVDDLLDDIASDL